MSTTAIILVIIAFIYLDNKCSKLRRRIEELEDDLPENQVRYDDRY